MRARVTRQLLEINVQNVTGTDRADRVFTATGLLPRTNYTFNVMAVNSEGEVGPPATVEAITATPTGRPASPCKHPMHPVMGHCSTLPG